MDEQTDAWKRAFCPSEFGMRAPEDCLFHFVPVPLERSVSYGGGASRGPDAILQAAEELEPVYLGTQPGFAGSFTHPPIDCEKSRKVEAILDDLTALTRDVLYQGKVPAILGGEHTVTLGAAYGLLERHPNAGLIQLDAHADLREAYLGDPFSHASVIRRIHERFRPPILQIGIRGICVEEVVYRREHGIHHLDAPQLHLQGVTTDLIPPDFPQEVYLTFDIDCLDASLMPATGTPSPGGLFWHQIEAILAAIVKSGRRILGFDVVELAPIPGFHSADFIGAVATYACMHAVLASRGELEAFVV